MIAHAELTREHEVLLRATLGHGQMVIDAWHEWQQGFDLAAMDAEGYALLPQLYLRLSQLGVQDGSLAKFKGIHRHTWCRNQVIMSRMAGALARLQERGIRSLLLNGTAFLARSQVGLLPLEKFEFLVPGTRFADATAMLRQGGWSQHWRPEEESARLSHSVDFTHSDGTTATVYRSLFAESTPSWADEDVWRNASPATVQDVSVSVLSATDHLLRLLIEVDLGYRTYSPRWVADVGTVLTMRNGATDWGRLRSKCAALYLTLPLKRSVAALQTLPAFRCPRELRELTDSLPTRWVERHEDDRRHWGPALRWRATGALATHWCRYKRVVGKNGRLPGFVKYLQEAWELPSAWLLPLAAMGKWRRRWFA